MPQQPVPHQPVPHQPAPEPSSRRPVQVGRPPLTGPGQRMLHARRAAELVDGFDRSPAYRGLAEAFRVLIGDGRLPVGVRLPSERDLTAALGLSRTTVARAYAELREHGFLTSRRGSGWVASLPASRGHRGDHVLPPGDLPAGKTDLTCAAPLAGPGLRAAYERALAELPGYLGGTGYYPSGLPVLREAVAAGYAARGLPTDPDQVMVVPGALAGIALAAQTLLVPGTRTVVESPTYPNAIAALGRAGARLAGVDAGAAWAAELTATVRQVAPQVGYLVPDFHNPTGRLREDAEREQVAAALRRSRTTVIADESLVTLALDGQAMPAPFAAHHPDTISVGSLSKPFWGGLRIGWLRVPSGLMDAVVRTRLSLDLGAPLLEQLVAADLLRDGEDLLAHRRRQLRESRDAAFAAVRRHLPSWRVERPGGGLCLWCELPHPASSALVPLAAEQDILLAAGPNFAPEGGLDRFVRLPYTLPASVLREAIAALAPAWERVGAATAGTLRQHGTTMVA